MSRPSISGDVIGCALRVHRELGPGFLESVYQRSLAIELRHQGIEFEQLVPLIVSYREQPVGRFIADFLVQTRLLLELKACSSLAQRDEAQLLNYLKATSIQVGLLLNFGANSLQVKRRVHRLPPGHIV